MARTLFLSHFIPLMFGTSFGDGKAGVSLLIAFQHIHGSVNSAFLVWNIGK
jgi:hypothetical protein